MGDSATGGIRSYLNKNKNSKYYGEIHNFNDDISTGPIYHLEENLISRVNWIKKINNIIDEHMDDASVVLKINTLYKKELDINKDTKIIVWTGNNVIEQIGLRYIVNRFKKNEIYMINVSKFSVNCANGTTYFPIATGECSFVTIGRLIESISLIDNDEKEKLISEWSEIIESHGGLRIFYQNKIKCVTEDYYDKEIIKNITNEYKLAARIIGEVMGMSSQLISDSYLHNRVVSLLEENKICYKGDVNSLRTLYLKKK
jgi:hypothetical protein